MELLPVHKLMIKTILFVDNVFRASNFPPYLVERTLLGEDQFRALNKIIESNKISPSDSMVLNNMYRRVRESGDVYEARRLYRS